MPHNDAGADLPLVRSAWVIATYVFAGNVSNPRQFQTAFGVLPVSSATAGLPPRASITSLVVVRKSVIGRIISKDFGYTSPPVTQIVFLAKFFGKVHSKTMPNRISPLDNSQVAHRLQLLRIAVSGNNQSAFAARLGIEPRRWNNFERGSPLSKEIAILLAQKIPGVSLDWLYLGKVEALPFALQRELELAGNVTKSADRTAG